MLDSNKFITEIEKMVLDKKISYLDAIIDYCENTGMEIETAAKMINFKIKQAIELEASDLNLMKEKINKLPL